MINLTNGMLLYHGSYTEVPNIEIAIQTLLPNRLRRSILFPLFESHCLIKIYKE